MKLGRLAEGNHTIRLVLDPDLRITDANEATRDKYRNIDHQLRVNGKMPGNGNGNGRD